ncbi:uncharacterized protein LOC119921608 [Tachyglossus aculeatus]|uniref:uncharacterized protein LOC119921608 n=1 Tax=Tachyglossus aculeatus TaxID=9261 RepID=UPI0018F71649|nr:uncharacterized protein LOC119921608 [Tachyglossus aculeatus]
MAEQARNEGQDGPSLYDATVFMTRLWGLGEELVSAQTQTQDRAGPGRTMWDILEALLFPILAILWGLQWPLPDEGFIIIFLVLLLWESQWGHLELMMKKEKNNDVRDPNSQLEDAPDEVWKMLEICDQNLKDILHLLKRCDMDTVSEESDCTICWCLNQKAQGVLMEDSTSCSTQSPLPAGKKIVTLPSPSLHGGLESRTHLPWKTGSNLTSNKGVRDTGALPLQKNKGPQLPQLEEKFQQLQEPGFPLSGPADSADPPEKVLRVVEPTPSESWIDLEATPSKILHPYWAPLLIPNSHGVPGPLHRGALGSNHCHMPSSLEERRERVGANIPGWGLPESPSLEGQKKFEPKTGERVALKPDAEARSLGKESSGHTAVLPPTGNSGHRVSVVTDHVPSVFGPDGGHTPRLLGGREKAPEERVAQRPPPHRNGVIISLVYSGRDTRATCQRALPPKLGPKLSPSPDNRPLPCQSPCLQVLLNQDPRKHGGSLRSMTGRPSHPRS